MLLTDFIIRILLAVSAGMLIGFERQWHHKSEGLRTNTLVTIGAAFYVLLALKISPENGDITRITGQVVTGVGFLGAGIIFREGTNIHGLTTATTVWCSAAIGCMAGAGYIIETFAATFTIIFINTLLMYLDTWLNNR